MELNGLKLLLTLLRVLNIVFDRLFYQSSTVNITVYVSDVNDNSPQFTSPTGYQFSVKEGTAGLTVGIVKVNHSIPTCG